MSEAKEAPKKKGKLPIILIVVVVLAAGGFFKMKGGGKKEAPAVKLGETESLGEFLLNLNGSEDGETYLRAEISMQMKEGVKKEEFEKDLPAIKDTVLQILRTKTAAELSARNMPILKFEIAAKVNKLLNEASEKSDGADEGKKKKKKKDEEEESADPEEREHPDWDSDEGPVLKVFFTSFATQ